jgi:cysteinyl-tRNA synthetase
MELIRSREEARKNKDWAQSDAMRDRLMHDGICIKDTKDGTEWYLDSARSS